MALAMKVVMPAGFMPMMSDGRIVVGMCSGTGQTTMVVTIPGLEHRDADRGEHGGKTSQPCAFAGLGTPALAAADPVLLAIAILFALALGMRFVPLMPVAAPRSLRPPLRGPPATA